MSPFNDPNVHVRQRHVSAGHVPVSSSHTIHYRPGSEFDSPGPAQFGNYQGQGAAANNGDTVQAQEAPSRNTIRSRHKPETKHRHSNLREQ